MTEITFDQTGDFNAVNAARKWLQDHGYSYGSMCLDMPIGILKGSWAIAKWRNLTAKERKQLDGQIVSSDFRDGPVVIQLKDAATDQEIKSGKRIKQESVNELDHAQFLWCTNWCAAKGLSPYDAKNWADAKAEYLKVLHDIN